MKTLIRLAASAAFALAAIPASAQDRDGGLTVSVGPGLVLRPEFPGARDVDFLVRPVIDVYRTDEGPSFETPDEGFGFGVVGNDRFRIGPTIQIQSGRDEEDAILGIGDVGTTVEGGAFVESFVSPNLRLRAEVRKGFGGHKGVVGDLGADFIMGSIDDFQLSVGPRLRLANERYVRAFYGVNPAQSALTGLPVYDVDGGLHSAGALLFANYRISDRLRLHAFGRYDRLLGDARHSPLVLSDVGSRNQYEAGIGLAYAFRIR